MAQGLPPEAHWRDSSRSPRFFFIDASAAFPLMFFFMHIRLWTFIVAVVAVLFFTLLNRYGFSIKVFLRTFRSKLAGKRKLAIPWWIN